MALPLKGHEMKTYNVIVENLGTIYTGANGAQAMIEYGRAKLSASQPGGRDGWSEVTLMRDGEILLEYRPGPFWFIEVTDTFGGEANYSWVTRIKVQAPTMRGAVNRFSRDSGARWQCVGDYGDSRRYDSRSGATCFFIQSWDDETHGEYLRVQEL